MAGGIAFAAPPLRPAQATPQTPAPAPLPASAESAEKQAAGQASPVQAALAASAVEAAKASGTASSAPSGVAAPPVGAPSAAGATSTMGKAAPLGTPGLSAGVGATAPLHQTTPPLTWLLDPAGTLTLSEVLFPSRQQAFAPYNPYDPFTLPRQAGTVWFRLELGATQASAVVPPLVLDLNTRVAGQIPGTPQVWLVARGENSGTLIFPKGDDLFQIPAPLPEQAVLYIRTSGLPAPGFAPMLRSVDSLTSVDREGLQILLVVLGLCLLLCLARGVAERREWRMWAALYTGAVWVQAFWGLPSTPAGVVSLWDMPGLLAPGVALLILPHVGRHLMRTREQATFIDAQLMLLALPGMALSVAPLVPGYAWTLRFLPLWPLLMLLLVPSVLGARLRKLPGARRFLLICLFPPLGLGVAGLFVLFPQGADTFPLSTLFQPGIVSLIPLAGLVLSALFTALASSPRPIRRGSRNAKGSATSEKDSSVGRRGAILELGAPLRGREAEDELELSLDAPDKLPARGIRSIDPYAERKNDPARAWNDAPHAQEPAKPLVMAGGDRLTLDTSDMPLPYGASGAAPKSAPQSVPTAGTSADSRLRDRKRALPVRMQEPLPLGLVEEALRVPLEAVLREVSAIDQARLDPETRRHAEALGRAGRSLAGVVGNLEQAIAQSTAPRPRKELFDLNQLLLEAHDTVVAQAEAKNLALSWFVAPHLPRRYEGPRAQLADVLALLAESSVRATERGMVQIRAQRLPESTDPGHLLFTVSDSGKGTPPLTRSSLALIRAWELVGPSGDLVTMESGPTGFTVSFSVRLTAHMAEQRVVLADSDSGTLNTSARAADASELLSRLPASALRIIVASGIPGNRQLLAYYLDELPHEILESRSAEEVRSVYFRAPGALIVFDDDIPEDDISSAVADIRAFEGEHGFPLASILTLVSDEARGERLHRAGCTHFLLKPIVRTELRHLTLRLAPVPRRYGNTFTEAPVQISGKPSSTRSNIPAAAKVASPSAGTPVAQTFASGVRTTGKTDLPGAALANTSGAANTPGAANTSGALNTPAATLEEPTENVAVTSAGVVKPKTGLLAALFSASKHPSPAASPSGTGQKTASHTSRRPEGQPAPTPVDEAKRARGKASVTMGNVGEPMPISKPADEARSEAPVRKPEPLRVAKVAPPASAQPFMSTDSSVDWVGEPTPIVKSPSEHDAAKSKPALPAEAQQRMPQAVHPDVRSEAVSRLLLKPTLPPPLATSAPEECSEWVGEPTPIPKHARPEAESTDRAQPERLVLDVQRDADEWVGEPMPIPKRSVAAAPVSLEPDEPKESTDKPMSLLALQEDLPAEDVITLTDKVVELASDKAIHQLLLDLDAALEQAIQGQEANDMDAVHDATAIMVKLAADFDLRVLDDPAQCMEIAAREGDVDEIAQLMPDLIAAVARNRTAFETN